MHLLKQLVFVAMLAFAVSAQAEIQAGKDYGVLNEAKPTHTGNKIEVLEFFFYGCTHCFHLHPLISEWEKKAPKDVDLVYVPVVFRDSWEPMARTFYALETLGQQKRLHDDLFNAWNLNNVQIDSEATATEFVSQLGVDREKFGAAYNSFAVNSKVMRANQMMQDYGIRGTPTLVVNGKYVITGLQPEDTVRVLDELVAKSRKERVAKKK